MQTCKFDSSCTNVRTNVPEFGRLGNQPLYDDEKLACIGRQHAPGFPVGTTSDLRLVTTNPRMGQRFKEKTSRP